MSKTQEDLKAAFAGESQANRKYLAFAKAAEKEGKTNLAKLFRAVAEGETIHALKHFESLGEVKDSADNVKAALAGLGDLRPGSLRPPDLRDLVMSPGETTRTARHPQSG
ncbi:MAG: hypothetical protein HGB14_11505 [Anaerolineaceae bacterium]|nr:hypothetical protein [Anaerolineaceae bacterium]